MKLLDLIEISYCLPTLGNMEKHWLGRPLSHQCFLVCLSRFVIWLYFCLYYISSVPPDLRSAVYLYGMSNSGEKEWDIMFKRLLKTNVASERRKLMYGLAGTPEPWIINR